MSQSHYRGAMIGLAVGDALGAQVEFQPRGGFPPQTEMAGGGPWGLVAGQWTDDTIMAMCTAEVLVERGEWDAKAVMDNYLRWYHDGHWSPKGYCFDIGGTTSRALERYEESGDPYAGSTDPRTQANGSIMRLAPVPLLYAGNPVQAASISGLSSTTTHAHPVCVDACRLLGSLLAQAVRGGWESKADFLAASCAPDHFGTPLREEIDRLRAGGWREKTHGALSGSGYVVDTLETALWCFWHTASFDDGLVATIDVGDDTDTTGAVYGQLAGAYYGVDAIPAPWVEKLWRREEILAHADRLRELAAEMGTIM